ncbi:MAG TPA: hypothetical protein VHG91_13905 [Longimicrobium sp.]|nr:hypothetical protein [Longimicrobium sp.]
MTPAAWACLVLLVAVNGVCVLGVASSAIARRRAEDPARTLPERRG